MIENINHTHVALDIISASIGLAIALLARSKRVYGRGPNMNLYLVFFGISVAFLDTMHVVVPYSGLVERMSFFSPMSWFAAKLPLPILVALLCMSPKVLPRYAVGSVLVAIISMWVIVPSNTNYYFEGWEIGRPYDLILLPVILACMWVIRHHPRDTITIICGSSLLLMVAQQLTMACSQELYDAPFQMAHIIHSLSLVPFLMLSVNGVKIVYGITELNLDGEKK